MAVPRHKSRTGHESRPERIRAAEGPATAGPHHDDAA